MAEMTTEKKTLQDKLRAWAKGSLPTMAAIDFLIECNQLSGAYVHVEGETAWYDFHTLEDDLRLGKLNFLSGGERATLKLAVSLRFGQIEDALWNLDTSRQQAFVNAVIRHTSAVAPMPKLEVLVVRDPDELTVTTVFIDGIETEGGYVEEDVDPGAGYALSDWLERTQDVRDADYSDAFKAAVVESREAYNSSEFIDERA